MEELPDGEEVPRMRKEQERERRRLRDRERRQSMSLEERERHLARRRRNYQLRRQKAENARLDSEIQSIGGGAMLTPNQHLVLTSASDSSVYSAGGAVRLGLDQGQCKKHESLDVPAYKLAKLSGRLRLNRLKRLARTLDISCGELGGVNHVITAELVAKGNGAAKCALSSGLRLNRVKRLARSSSSSTKENGTPVLDQSKIYKDTEVYS